LHFPVKRIGLFFPRETLFAFHSTIFWLIDYLPNFSPPPKKYHLDASSRPSPVCFFLGFPPKQTPLNGDFCCLSVSLITRNPPLPQTPRNPFVNGFPPQSTTPLFFSGDGLEPPPFSDFVLTPQKLFSIFSFPPSGFFLFILPLTAHRNEVLLPAFSPRTSWICGLLCFS